MVVADKDARLRGVIGTIASGSLLGEVRYEYDALNRRVARWLDSSANGVSNREEFYVYDGDDVALDFVDANGAAGGLTPVLDKRYLHGPAVDQILAQEDVTKTLSTDERVLWMLTDNQGSVRDVVDNGGDAVSHMSYDAFGNIVGGTGVLLTRYLWTGRELDTTTGLQYNRHRWYDSTLGRWVSEDPIGFAGGDYNLSRYARNETISLRDPTGLASEKALVVQIGQLVKTGRLRDLREAIQLLTHLTNGVSRASPTVMREVLGAILKRFPILGGGCQQAARFIQTALENAGYKGSQIITLIGSRKERYLEIGGQTIAIHGKHDAVLLDGRVYDAITGPSGMKLADYLAWWAQNGTPVVVK